MIHQDISLYLMETLRCWISLHGYIVVLMLLSTFSTGSTCEAPSSPQCFRRKADDTVYCCEWNMNTTERDVTYNLYIGEKQFANIKKPSHEITEEQLIRHRPVNIWVEAYAGNSSCTSTRKSVELQHTVKYEAPQNITMTWLKNNLYLNWKKVEKHPALAEVRYRQDQYPSESWETRLTNTTNDTVKYQVIVVNLLNHTAYQVQIRHRSNQAVNPQWSDWSPVVILPAELEQKPQVSITTSLMNGTRKVTLKWKPVPHAAAVSGVTYSIRATQSSRRCPCKMREHRVKSKTHTVFVSLSAVNISVTARNAAGYSPPSITQVLPVTAVGLKTCNKTLLGEKLKRKTCLELYEMQDEDSMPKDVITLTKRKDINKTLKDYVRYLYFEHRCNGGIPQTVKMCLFYHKEGVPNSEPQDLSPSGETQSSVSLSWKPIPSESQRGFLSHYSLCSTRISSQEEPNECHNISASVLKHSLENLTPGAKYKISLAGVTLKGEGPKATVTINTLPENSVNVLPWSLSSLFVFFLLLTVCTCVLTRNKNKFFPPVPTPVIPNFTHYEPESQKMLERKEEVDKLTLHQLHPEGKSTPEGAEEITVVGGVWNDDTDEDIESERSDSRMSGGASDEHLSPSSTEPTLRSSTEAEMTDLEKVDNEIAMLIYRNGLVFDVKTDSS